MQIQTFTMQVFIQNLIKFVAVIANLLLRSAWAFSISPDIAEKIARPELFTAIIGTMEIFRRSIWNFLR
jgi:hypothetical protein